MTAKLDDDEHLYLITGRCCTDWPLLLGIPPRRCGLCGERPVLLPGTERTVPRKRPDGITRVWVSPNSDHAAMSANNDLGSHK